jgi:hypothetical protein
MNKLVMLVALLSVAVGCAEQTAVNGTVHHLVICWLKEPGNAAHRRSIRDASLRFREIPTVLEVRVGEAVPSDRPIVDDSYDVAVEVRFASVEDMNTYLEHPLHAKAKDEVLMPLVSKLLVYDFAE